MSWSKNVFRIASAGFMGVLLSTTATFAQVPAENPAVQTQSSITRNADESVSAFIARVSGDNPQNVAGAIADILRNTPADLSEILLLASSANSPGLEKADVFRGLVLAASANPVAITQQISAFALANMTNVAAAISAARGANTNSFSEVVGEGLALAASSLRAQGTSKGNADAIAIQTQATAQAAPLALSEAFMDNYIATAAGAAGAGAPGPGGGGDVSNNAGTFNAGAGTTGAGGGVAQQGASRTSFASGGGLSISRTTGPVTNFATVPVPGPEAGAGLGALATGLFVYWARRRNAKANDRNVA